MWAWATQRRTRGTAAAQPRSRRLEEATRPTSTAAVRDRAHSASKALTAKQASRYTRGVVRAQARRNGGVGSSSRRWRDRPRRGWSDADKQRILERQGHKCARQYAGCSGLLLPNRYAFDHKDGQRDNRSLDNAQALCLNCHGVKTAIEKGRESAE